MEESPLYPNCLRALIEKAGYSFKEVSKEAHISERTLYYWAAGERIIPRDDRATLARVIGCTAEDLAPCQMSQGMVQSSQNYSQLQGKEGMNRKRRELLQLLNVANSSLIWPDIAWERVERVTNKPSFLDESGLRDLEAINHHYWCIYLLAFARMTVLEGVLEQLKTLVGFLQASHPLAVYRGLNVLVCDLAQLAGEIFFDINDYDTAQSCYTIAATVAKEVKHHDLWACALVRNAFLPIYDERYEDALPLLMQAERIAKRGDTALVTGHWVAAVLAEAHAGAGNLLLCQDALDLAEKVRNIQNGDNGGWLRFNGARLPEQRGTCFVSLKQPNLALPALNEALTKHSSPTRRRGMVLNDLARVALQQQDIEQACTYAHQVIEIALQGSSGMLRKRLYILRAELQPFAQTEVVKQLDKHFNVLLYKEER